MTESEAKTVIDYYAGDVPRPERRALVTYLVSPFFINPDSAEFNARQDVWQARNIADTFNELGYVVDVIPHDEPSTIPTNLDQYDVLFGFGESFDECADRLGPGVQKLYYVIGTHWRWRNPRERDLLDRLQRRRGAVLEPERQLPESDGPDVADALVVLGDHYFNGDDFIEQTYIDHVGSKPSPHVRLSSFDWLKCTIDGKEFGRARKHFLWFGGSGLVLKGLDVALEAFASFTDLHLHVCGPVSDHDAFVKTYETELFRTENVHFHGYVNVTSDEFCDVTSECAFVLNPSGSGVILPGGVITCMHRGLVPIVVTEQPVVSPDWCRVLEDRRVGTVADTVRRAAELSPDRCETMARSACNEAKANYTRQAFHEDLRRALLTVLDVTC